MTDWLINIDPEIKELRAVLRTAEIAKNRLVEFAKLYNGLAERVVDATRGAKYDLIPVLLEQITACDNEADRYSRNIFPESVYIAQLYLDRFYHERTDVVRRELN